MSHLFLSLGSQPFINLDWQVVAQLLNTLILFLILKKILFVKVKEFIDARQTEVDKMYADADTAMAEAERLKNVYSESVAGARDEAQRIVTDAARAPRIRPMPFLAEAVLKLLLCVKRLKRTSSAKRRRPSTRSRMRFRISRS